MKNDRRTIKQDLEVIKAVFILAKRLNPMAYITMISLRLIESLIPFVNIIFPAMILNELIGAQDWQRLMMLVAATVGLNFSGQLARRALSRTRLHHQHSFGLKSMLELAKATVSMDYKHAEDPSIMERRIRIQEGWNYYGDVSSLVSMVCNLGQGMLTTLLSSGIIIQMLMIPSLGGQSGILQFIDSPLASVTLLAMIGCALMLTLRNTTRMNDINSESMNAAVKNNRDFTAVLSNLSNYRFGQDIRLYGMEPMYEEFLAERKRNIIHLTKLYQGKARRFLTLNSVASSVVTFAIYGFVALKAALGTVPIGNVLLYVGAIAQFNAGCSLMINWYAQLRFKASLDQETIDYLNLPQVQARGTLPIEKRDDQRYEFEVRNLSFRYPGSEEYVLHNVNLKIVIGERMAIVGMNGSGKTTLIKLLCRLYDPTEGEILLNGIDISKYDLDEYLTLFSVVSRTSVSSPCLWDKMSPHR